MADLKAVHHNLIEAGIADLSFKGAGPVTKELYGAIKAFLAAFTKGVKEVIADPKTAIGYVKARDGIINEALELRRLQLAIDATVLTPDARSEGFGNVMPPRLALMASPMATARRGVSAVRRRSAASARRCRAG